MRIHYKITARNIDLNRGSACPGGTHVDSSSAHSSDHHEITAHVKCSRSLNIHRRARFDGHRAIVVSSRINDLRRGHIQITNRGSRGGCESRSNEIEIQVGLGIARKGTASVARSLEKIGPAATVLNFVLNTQSIHAARSIKQIIIQSIAPGSSNIKVQVISVIGLKGINGRKRKGIPSKIACGNRSGRNGRSIENSRGSRVIDQLEIYTGGWRPDFFGTDPQTDRLIGRTRHERFRNPIRTINRSRRIDGVTVSLRCESVGQIIDGIPVLNDPTTAAVDEYIGGWLRRAINGITAVQRSGISEIGKTASTGRT